MNPPEIEELRGRLRAIELYLAQLTAIALATSGRDIDATAREMNVFDACQKHLTPAEFKAGQESTEWMLNVAMHSAKNLRGALKNTQQDSQRN